MTHNEWRNPRRVVLVAHPRSGSTMLATALDSHNDIGFERGEPLSDNQIWMQNFRNKRRIFRIMLNRPGYKVVGFRVTYKTIPPGFWRMLRGNNVKIIHLTRKNVLRTLISAEINTAVRDGKLQYPDHTFHMTSEPPTPLTVNVPKMMERARKLAQWKIDMRWEIVNAGLDDDTFDLTYEDLVFGGAHTTIQMPVHINRELCDFLGVRNERLVTITRRLNPFKIQDLIANHEELLEYFLDSEFKQYAELEINGHA